MRFRHQVAGMVLALVAGVSQAATVTEYRMQSTVGQQYAWVRSQAEACTAAVVTQELNAIGGAYTFGAITGTTPNCSFTYYYTGSQNSGYRSYETRTVEETTPPSTSDSNTVQCGSACTVTIKHDFAASMTSGKVDDYMAMFWTFVLAAIGVWGARRLLGLFTGDYKE